MVEIPLFLNKVTHIKAEKIEVIEEKDAGARGKK